MRKPLGGVTMEVDVKLMSPFIDTGRLGAGESHSRRQRLPRWIAPGDTVDVIMDVGGRARPRKARWNAGDDGQVSLADAEGAQRGALFAYVTGGGSCDETAEPLRLLACAVQSTVGTGLSFSVLVRGYQDPCKTEAITIAPEDCDAWLHTRALSASVKRIGVETV